MSLMIQSERSRLPLEWLTCMKIRSFTGVSLFLLLRLTSSKEIWQLETYWQPLQMTVILLLWRSVTLVSQDKWISTTNLKALPFPTNGVLLKSSNMENAQSAAVIEFCPQSMSLMIGKTCGALALYYGKSSVLESFHTQQWPIKWLQIKFCWDTECLLLQDVLMKCMTWWSPVGQQNHLKDLLLRCSSFSWKLSFAETNNQELFNKLNKLWRDNMRESSKNSVKIEPLVASENLYIANQDTVSSENVT